MTEELYHKMHLHHKTVTFNVVLSHLKPRMSIVGLNCEAQKLEFYSLPWSLSHACVLYHTMYCEDYVF